MTIHHFGTSVNPAQYVEITDPANPGQVKRPDAGFTLKVKNASTLGDLPDVTVQTLGYWSMTTQDVPAILVSGDNGVSWVGPLKSAEQEAAEVTAAATATAAAGAAADANTTAGRALTKAQQALDAVANVGTGNANIVPILLGQPDPSPLVEGSLLAYYV